MSSRRARPTVRALIVCAGVCLTWLVSPPLIGQNARPAQGEAPRLDPARELVMKIDAPFTVAAVGDIFGAMAPIVPLEEPRLQSLLKIIRDADVGFANAESSIADLPRFEGPVGGLLAPKAAAADMKAMGIRSPAAPTITPATTKTTGCFPPMHCSTKSGSYTPVLDATWKRRAIPRI